MLPSTKPMKRNGFARADRIEGREVKRMKQSRPKMTPIRASARDEECTLMIAGQCLRTTDTTVLCHSNLLADGKGMRLKAPDTRACYGCDVCHAILDGRRTRPGWLSYEALLDIFERAVVLTHERLKTKGLLP